MTKKYNQLTLEQRYKIETLRSEGFTQSHIARVISVNASTVCRELRRNMAQRGTSAGVYVAARAEEKTRLRHQQKPRHIRFTEALQQEACQWITHKRYSPELVWAEWKKGH